MYKEFQDQNASDFSIIMGKALLNQRYKKIGFGYYFVDNTELYFFAIFDSF